MTDDQGKRPQGPTIGGPAKLLVGGAFLALAAIIYLCLAVMEDRGSVTLRGKIAGPYKLFGKTGVALVPAIPGVIFLVVGAVQTISGKKGSWGSWPCPDCGEPISRKPTNRQQFLWGGGTWQSVVVR